MMLTHIYNIGNQLIKKYLKNFLLLQKCKSVTTFFIKNQGFLAIKTNH